MTVPNTAEFTNIRRLPVPPHNPLNAMDAAIPLARPCERCDAREGQPCRPECHRPQPIGPALIYVLPGDEYDPNPDIHPAPAPKDRWKAAL